MAMCMVPVAIIIEFLSDHPLNIGLAWIKNAKNSRIVGQFMKFFTSDLINFASVDR